MRALSLVAKRKCADVTGAAHVDFSHIEEDLQIQQPGNNSQIIGNVLAIFSYPSFNKLIRDARKQNNVILVSKSL